MLIVTFKSKEILNLRICSLLLLLPCKPKLGFHNWHQTKKKKICFRKDDWLCSCDVSETILVAGTLQRRCPVLAGPSTNPNEGSMVRMAGSGLWHLFEETIASRNLREDCRGGLRFPCRCSQKAPAKSQRGQRKHFCCREMGEHWVDGVGCPKPWQ